MDQVKRGSKTLLDLFFQAYSIKQEDHDGPVSLTWVLNSTG